MFHRQTLSTTKSSKRRTPNKLIAGIAAVLATGVITTASFAAAAPNSKPSKEWCNQNGYTNYGQCVRAWGQTRGATQGGGNGYGGTVNNNNINLTVNSNGQRGGVFNAIINIFN